MDTPRWPVRAGLHGHLLKRVEHVLASDKLAKDGVLVVEVLRGAESEVPLGAEGMQMSTRKKVHGANLPVRIFPAISHG